MSRNLFVYGTLQDPDVRELLLPNQKHKTYPAVWENIQLYQVEGENYPCPRYVEGRSTPGLILYDVTDEQWAKIMNFEDEYNADVISFTLDTNELAIALLFVPKDHVKVSDTEWSFAQWLKDKPAFLEKTKNYLATGQW